MTSGRRTRLVERPRPDHSRVLATAPGAIPSPRHSLPCATALSLSLPHFDSIDRQASAVRCRGRSRSAQPCPTTMDGGRTRAAASRPPQRACARRERLPQPHRSRLLAITGRARARSSRPSPLPAGTSFATSVYEAKLHLLSAPLEVCGRRSKQSPPLTPFHRSAHPSSLSRPRLRAVAHLPPSAPTSRLSTLPHALGRCSIASGIASGRAAAPRGSRLTAAAHARRVPNACSDAARRAIAGPVAAVWATR